MAMVNRILDIQRHFLPFQEWVYYKIYSGPKTLDLILIQDIRPVLMQLTEADLIKGFFFIRYRDSEEHIRLRLKIGSQRKIHQITNLMNKLFSYLKAARVINRVTVDTYSREIERYGEFTVQLIEDLFHLDSRFVLECLYQNSFKENIWLNSISFSNLIFELFGLGINDRIEFCELMFTGYSREYNYSKRLKVSLDAKYREYSEQITHYLLSPPNECRHLMEDYKIKAKPILYKIFGIYSLIGKDSRRDLISSLLHMHFNRMFKHRQRAQEFVVYYFLKKGYSSIRARNLL